MEIDPIGKVHESERQEIKRIEVYPEYAEGLEGIDSEEEIVVCYWMHELDEETREKLVVHPRGNPENPLRGVFSLRSPMRPNPIGITPVELVERRGNDLFVRGLDAFDGSPVIDIKGSLRGHAHGDGDRIST